MSIKHFGKKRFMSLRLASIFEGEGRDPDDIWNIIKQRDEVLIISERRRDPQELAILKSKLAKFNVLKYRFFSLYELEEDWNRIYLSDPDPTRTFASLMGFRRDK